MLKARFLVVSAATLLLAACGTTTAINDGVDAVRAEAPVNVGSVPVGVDTAVVAGALALAPTVTLFGHSVFSPAEAALFYIIWDPLAPNWRIEERVVDEQTYHLALRAKNFRTGGDGEAIQVLKRRALKLQREKGYASYRILEYSEGIESATPFSYRVSEGTIQLVNIRAPDRR